MFLVYYTEIMQFSIFSKNSLHPLHKINLTHNRTPLWNQNFLTYHKIFYWNFSPTVGPTSPILEDGEHAMTLPN